MAVGRLSACCSRSDSKGYAVLVIVLGAGLFGTLSTVYGDSFWENLGTWLWW